MHLIELIKQPTTISTGEYMVLWTVFALVMVTALLQFIAWALIKPKLLVGRDEP